MPVTRYAGGLFQPAGPASEDPVARAIAAFENSRTTPSDYWIHRILELLTRSRVKVRQGVRTMEVETPIDFSDLSSEYIGILYESLLDYQLRQAPHNQPIVFLGDDGPAPPVRVPESQAQARQLTRRVLVRPVPGLSRDGLGARGWRQEPRTFLHHFRLTAGRGKTAGSRKGDKWTVAIKQKKDNLVLAELKKLILGKKQPAFAFVEEQLSPAKVHDQVLAVFERLHNLPVHEVEERKRVYEQEIAASKVNRDASLRRKPAPSRTPSSARSRSPMRVVGSGAASSCSACSRESQFPKRVPARRAPRTRSIAVAVSGRSSPLSAASTASLRMADNRTLMLAAARLLFSSSTR
jgi:hypothetical protein